MNAEELKQRTREVDIAKQSACEELRAIEDYTERLKVAKDPELRKAIEHAREEEQQHLALFSKWLKKHGG